MRKLLLLPAAAFLLAGCDFSSGDEAVAAPIARIQVSDVTAPAGSATEFFVEIQNATGRSFYRSAVDRDLSDGFSVGVMNAEVPSATMPLQMAVFNSNGGDLANANLVARSTYFSLEEIQAATGDDVEIASQAGPARFTVTRSAQ